jgi:hypothetical protein
MLVKAPANGAFVVSTQSEQELLSSFKWVAPLAVSGGVALTGLGAWLAILGGWNPLIIVGLVGAGFIIGLFIKRFKSNFILGG